MFVISLRYVTYKQRKLACNYKLAWNLIFISSYEISQALIYKNS